MPSTKFIKYLPSAGLTIEEAIAIAIMKAVRNDAVVEADINDILLYITKKANVDKYVKLYRRFNSKRR